jgi:hypothetical protein
MQHAAILNIAAFTDVDVLGIAAYHDPEPNTAVLAQLHIAHDLGAVGYIGGVGNGGANLVKFVNGHGNS